jgi:hypothetical protein
VDGGRIRISDNEPLCRRRLAVLFRALLFLPPYVLIAIWSLIAAAALIPAWVLLLVRGRPADRLHGFLAAYLRYVGQATAWFHLLSGRYPDPRRTREHPFAIDAPKPLPQPRAITLFRALLAVPAVVLASVLRVVLTLSAVAAWFAGIALGRTTAGLQELGTFCLRYELETVAYLLLLTSRYPRLAPE